MRCALHPDRDEQITVPSYIKAFGKHTNILIEQARCPICKQRLTIVAASSPDSIAHFAHRKGSGFCPTKIKSAAPYAGLPPRQPNRETALRIRSAFLENWARHFTQLNWLVKGLSTDEFIDVVRTANQERIWEYANLEEFQLPYIFATLMDFPPSRSYKTKDGKPARHKWFRCWFDASVQRYDDLWIHRDTPLIFWRAWYNLPAGCRKPKIEDLSDSYGSELSDEFLSKITFLPGYVTATISSWLSRNFKVDQVIIC
jgi:hypothetical protein